jgi:CheY-like chemotaxis protein
MKPLVCLLIDDDAEEAEIFHYALEELNRPVKCLDARSGKEAIAYLSKHPGQVDYIFLDMNMPRMSGVECMQQLRKLDTASSTPIVLYSSAFLEEQQEMLKALGARDFLVKTGSVFDLQNSLFRLFESHEVDKLTVA